MKKLNLILLALLLGVILLFIGCPFSNSPSAVVKKAFTAAKKLDLDKYYNEYFILDYPDNYIYLALIDDKMRSFAIAYEFKKITFENIEGDKAAVEVAFKNGQNYTFRLKKQNDKWKIYFSNLMGL